MRAPVLALLAATACLPERGHDQDANGPEIGETCTTVGVENVDTNDTTDENALLESYNAPYAVRVQLALEDGTHYVSGEVLSDDETGNFTCMADGAGACTADLYNNCANTNTGWTVGFNTSPRAATCSYLGLEGEPDCILDEDVLEITVEE